jgi:hypothetical protein
MKQTKLAFDADSKKTWKWQWKHLLADLMNQEN